MKKILGLCLLLSGILLFSSCEDKPGGGNLKGYDQEILKTWLDKIMIPAYKDHQQKVADLKNAAIEFDTNTTSENLENLKSNWVTAYKSFQKTMLLDIDVAYSTSYLGMNNTYPTVVSGASNSIENNIQLIQEGTPELVNLKPTIVESRQACQGFPALDYLLFSEGKNLAYFENNPAARQYMVMLSGALKDRIDEVVTYWNTNRDSYVNDQDESINGAYVRTLNAFVRVYEKNIRSFKVGYAAGAIRIQNGVPQPEIIEAYYNQEISKDLLKIALQNSQDFFNGKNFDGGESKSLKHILTSIGKQTLVENINKQYELMYQKIDAMPNTLRYTADNNTPEMVELYDLIQVNVANFKTEMLSALNASVNYADTDGD